MNIKLQINDFCHWGNEPQVIVNKLQTFQDTCFVERIFSSVCLKFATLPHIEILLIVFQIIKRDYYSFIIPDALKLRQRKTAIDHM